MSCLPPERLRTVIATQAYGRMKFLDRQNSVTGKWERYGVADGASYHIRDLRDMLAPTIQILPADLDHAKNNVA